jgi:hypothetical protein
MTCQLLLPGQRPPRRLRLGSTAQPRSLARPSHGRTSAARRLDRNRRGHRPARLPGRADAVTKGGCPTVALFHRRGFCCGGHLFRARSWPANFVHCSFNRGQRRRLTHCFEHGVPAVRPWRHSIMVVHEAALRGTILVAIMARIVCASSCCSMMAFQVAPHLLDPSSKTSTCGIQWYGIFDVQRKKCTRQRATPIALSSLNPSHVELARKAHSLCVSAFVSIAICAGVQISTALAENNMQRDNQPKAEGLYKVTASSTAAPRSSTHRTCSISAGPHPRCEENPRQGPGASSVLSASCPPLARPRTKKI